jgi:hypothetical protein
MFEQGVGIRNPLFFVGVIEDNDDPTLLGRVKVRAFSIHGTNKEISTEDLPWAMVSHGNYDPNNPLPSLNAFVWGMFLDGRDAQHPVVLGLLPTQFVEAPNPEANGYGVIPKRDGRLLGKGLTPRDFGQPQMSRLARGENVEETGVAGQEVNRMEKFKIGGTDKVWSEPQTAYATKYPHNRVIETAHHSIELDDTPGGERITIRHKEGSYIQIDSKGSVAEKSAGAKHDVTKLNKYEGVGHNHIVTIGGDAHVYVKGNKTEEIEGNYNLLVHGTTNITAGTQLNLNGSEQVQMRAADVNIQANVGTMAILAEKEIQMQGKTRVNIKGNTIYQHATLNPLAPLTTGKFEFFAERSMFFTSTSSVHMQQSNMYINCNSLIPDVALIPTTGLGFHLASGPGGITMDTIGLAHISGLGQVALQSTANISINAPFVAIDDTVALASGFAVPTLPSAIGKFALPTIDAGECKMPEPPAKSTSLSYIKFENTQSTGGYISAEE